MAIVISTGLISCSKKSNPVSSGSTVGDKPIIDSLVVNEINIRTNQIDTLNCFATDPDGHNLNFAWSAINGTLLDASGGFARWQAPLTPGDFYIYVTVSNSTFQVIDSTLISVSSDTAMATLSGYVTSSGGGAVEGADVCVSGNCIATASDGHYTVLSLPVGKNVVTVSKTGYQQIMDTLDLAARDNFHDYVLTPSK